MTKQILKRPKLKSFADVRKKRKMDYRVNASHELQIIQNISADQLENMEHTYTYMLEAIKEARRSKEKAEQQTADILANRDTQRVRYNRRCLTIAWLWEHGTPSKEIDLKMGKKRGYTMNRYMASHGRALKNEKIREAKKRLVIRLVNAGHGTRPTARDIPAALGKCSPALVCKIMKAEKMRQHPSLPFPLRVV